MTKKVNIKPHQTQLDISLQEYGTVESLFAILEANDISITATLSPGIVLNTPESITDSDVLTYYKENAIVVASAFDQTVAGSIQGIIYTTPPVKTNEVISQKNQTTLDIALQETGDIESLIELCELNNISITNELVPGTKLKNDSSIKNDEVLAYYQKRLIRCATGDGYFQIDGYYSLSDYVELNYWL